MRMPAVFRQDRVIVVVIVARSFARSLARSLAGYAAWRRRRWWHAAGVAGDREANPERFIVVHAASTATRSRPVVSRYRSSGASRVPRVAPRDCFAFLRFFASSLPPVRPFRAVEKLGAACPSERSATRSVPRGERCQWHEVRFFRFPVFGISRDYLLRVSSMGDGDARRDSERPSPLAYGDLVGEDGVNGFYWN